MKKKEIKEKIVLGVFLDGLTVRIAECHLKKQSVYVSHLKEFQLKEPLIQHEIPSLSLNDIPAFGSEESSFSFSDSKDVESSLDDMDDFMGINDEDEFMPKKPAEQEPVQTESPAKEEGILPQYDLNSSKFFEISRFLSQFPINTSLISFVTSEERLFWSYIPFSSKKIKRDKVKKQTLSKEQKKDPSVQFDLLINKNKSAFSLVYEGPHDIIKILENVQPILSIKNINYYHAEPIEVCLINAVLTQYRFNSDEYVLLLYLSKDNKIAIILQDDNYIKSFPLIIQASDPDIIREAIVSKIMLEQDISQLNITQNVLICGDFSGKDDMTFFKESFKSNFISAFSFSTVNNYQNNIPVEFDVEIPEYIIPRYVPSIMLGYRALIHKNKRLHFINMLPQLIIDKQKIFKLSWHGILILILVFIMTIWTTYGTLKQKIELRRIQNENQEYEFELNQKKAFKNILMQYTSQVDNFEQNRKQITDLIQKKNQWGYIINKISQFTSNHSYFWISDIKATDISLDVSGVSFNRNNITAFSNILPEGSIKKITLAKIESEAVWTYEISFSYPDPALYNPLYNEIKIEIDTLIIKPVTVKEEPVVVQTEVKKEQAPVKEKKVTPAPKNTEKKIIPAKKEEPKKEPKKEVKKEVKKEEPKKEIKKEIKKEEPQKESQNDPSALYVEARIHVQNAQYQEAIHKFAKFMSENPDHRLIPMANFLTAESYFLSDRYHQAIPFYLKVLELKKVKQLESLYMLGNTYEKMNKTDKAIHYFEELVKRYPNSSLTKQAEENIKRLKGENNAE